MKNKILFGSALTVLCGLVLPPVGGSLQAAPATETMTSRLPADLARADAGTKIEVRGASAAPAQMLLGNDIAASYTLPAGTTSMILSLSKIEIVNHFDFVNFAAEGKVTVSVSSAKLPFDSAEWREVVGGQTYEGRQLIPCDLGSVEARYVKIDFNTRAPGRIAGFNLFGLSSSVSKVDTKGKFHVSLTTPASANVEASFVFDSANPTAKVVADLGAQKSLERLTCAYEAPAGSLEFYLVDNLSAQERVGLNYVDEPSLQPVSNEAPLDSASVVAGHKAIYTVDTAAQPGGGKVTVDLSGLQGRYLVAAFRPAARHRSVDGKDTKDFANSAVEGKDKDSKAAPVFPAFTTSPAGFGNSPADTNTPLTPPPIGANSL